MNDKWFAGSPPWLGIKKLIDRNYRINRIFLKKSGSFFRRDLHQS